MYPINYGVEFGGSLSAPVSKQIHIASDIFKYKMVIIIVVEINVTFA